jgi:hypothetical protein
MSDGGGAVAPPPQPHRIFTRDLEGEERRLATSWKGVLFFILGFATLILIFIILTL